MDSEQFLSLPLERKILLAELPASNGIYEFVRGEEILYVGKSVNIKARVLSHLENAKIDNKEAAIVNNSDTIRYYITDTEYKALLLESQLIQKIMPQYNVRWRDDKSYLYIKITIKDEYPTVALSRKENDGKSRYFGPFPSVALCQEITRSIRRVFPFCTQKKIGKRPCFYSKLKLCDPCPSNIEKVEDPIVKKALKRKYRQNIFNVIKVLEGKADRIMGDLYKELQEMTKEQKYEEAIVLRNKIMKLEHFLQGRRLDTRDEEVFNQSEEGLKTLQSMLAHYYPEIALPQRIECFDISNTGLKNGTASMVVMTDGIINKKEYRKFRIKDEKLESDFEMMKEVLERRIRQTKWPTADLLVVDGGRPQVRIIQKVFAEMGYTVPLIGIAKNPDRLVIGTLELPTIRPPLRHPGFSLIRTLRDESHRFAKKYHVLLRTKQMEPVFPSRKLKNSLESKKMV